MGHKVKKDILNVQKSQLKYILVSMLEVDLQIMKFQLTLAKDTNDKKGLKKFIQQIIKAQDVIYNIKHYEILVSLYNAFINGKETYFHTLCKVVNSKDTKRWDNTQKGFKEFLELENQAKAKSKEEYERRLKQQEMIKQAKEQGKKVEMVYIDGKLQPRIVEEKPN